MNASAPPEYQALAAASSDAGWTPALLFGISGGLALQVTVDDLAAPLRGHRPLDRGELASSFPDWDPSDALPAVDTLPFEELVLTALRRDAQRMDRPAAPEAGLEGLARLVDTLPALSTHPEARALATSLYRAIHESGGLHRRLYRDFLLEAAEHAPTLTRLQLSISMTRVGDAWQTLANELRQAAEDETLDFSQAATYALAVQTFEETFWERILQAL